MNQFSLPRTLALSALLVGLLVACQTRQERDTVDTPPPPKLPAQESSQAPDSTAASKSAPEENASRDPASAESGEQQQPAQTDESVPSDDDAASGRGVDPDERATAENRPTTPPIGEDQETGQPASGATGETEPIPAGGASENAAQNSDQRFREAMQRFDRRLARERFGKEQRDEAAGGNGSAPTGGMGGGSDQEGEQAASSGSDNPFEGGGQETEHSSGTGRGGIGERNTHSPPPGTPDGHDDDIVARQLREAAESEPDPELRERLWEEYRAYKNDQE